MDWIPLLSQVKSLVQVSFGDAEGARRTQENFSRQCPVVGQIRLVTELAIGDTDGVEETVRQQKEFYGGVFDSVPVVGHVKGAIHYACGDKEGGDNAMKAASRTTGSVIGAVAGIPLGPAGIAAGAAAGAYVVDGITTGVDSAVHKEYRPNGYVSTVTEVVKDPKDPGKWFEAVAPPAMDALAVGKARIQTPNTGKASLPIRKRDVIKDEVKNTAKNEVKNAVKNEFNKACKDDDNSDSEDHDYLDDLCELNKNVRDLVCPTK